MIDDKEKKILGILNTHAKLSTQQISKKTKIPITTVHNRIKKLESKGIIKGYTTRIDHKKMGKGLGAFIQISVDYPRLNSAKLTQHDLAQNLQSLPEVEETAILAGGADILIKIRVANIEEMDTFVTKSLRNITGIEKTQTMIILKEMN